MGNVFRSKEVYARVNHNLHNRDEIIPVRGVYVSGEYRPPFYNEPVISITDINPIKCNIYSYTEKSYTSDADPILKLIDISMVNSTPEYEYYSSKTYSSKSDPILRLVDISMSHSEPQCVYYSTRTYSSKSDPILRLVDISMSHSEPSLVPRTYTRENSTPEPILQLTGLTSDDAIITDYIP